MGCDSWWVTALLPYILDVCLPCTWLMEVSSPQTSLLYIQHSLVKSLQSALARTHTHTLLHESTSCFGYILAFCCQWFWLKGTRNPKGKGCSYCRVIIVLVFQKLRSLWRIFPAYLLILKPEHASTQSHYMEGSASSGSLRLCWRDYSSGTQIPPQLLPAKRRGLLPRSHFLPNDIGSTHRGRCLAWMSARSGATLHRLHS